MIEIEKLFQQKVKSWTNLVENRDKREFAERMANLKSRFEEVNPNFGKAYENMYKIVEGR
jgi:hypothetical protein